MAKMAAMASNDTQTTGRKRLLLLMTPATYRAGAYIDAAQNLDVEIIRGLDLPKAPTLRHPSPPSKRRTRVSHSTPLFPWMIAPPSSPPEPTRRLACPGIHHLRQRRRATRG